jgi:cell division septation protein DedD
MLLLGAPVARADVVQEAVAARRRLDYDTAAARLQAALPELASEVRVRAQMVLATVVSDGREARRLWLEAARHGDEPTRRAADLELARLDFARGSYRTTLTRLEPWKADADAAFLMAQATAALGEHARTVEMLAAHPQSARVQALLGWSWRGTDPQRSLEVLESVVRDPNAGPRPAALLWKAECEVALEQPARAQASAREILGRYPEAPEADAARTLLRGLGPAGETPRPAGGVMLQIGAFEERSYAVRLQESLAEGLRPIAVTVVEDAGDLHRVHVGPFADRAAAEAFATRMLAPRRLTWSIVTHHAGNRP